jgi:CDP-4-dehydro-6-deoxyglucose reductase
MAQWIALSRSAHLLGISRRELQKLIQSGELHTFEGCVDLDELRRRFPVLAIDETSFIEHISFLQETAFSRRVRDTVMPTVDLASTLRKRTADLAVERARAKKYCGILRELTTLVATMQCDADGDTKRALNTINHWLLAQLDGNK